MKKFTEFETDQIVGETEHFTIVKDKFPVTEGHLLVVAKNKDRWYVTELNDEEWMDLKYAMWKGLLHMSMKPMDGMNVGFNIGRAGGQTIFQCHMHMIPRTVGDVDDPTGGIRNVIPGKGKYEEA